MWCLAVSLMTRAWCGRACIEGEWVSHRLGLSERSMRSHGQWGFCESSSRRTLRFVSARAIKRMPAA